MQCNVCVWHVCKKRNMTLNRLPDIRQPAVSEWMMSRGRLCFVCVRRARANSTASHATNECFDNLISLRGAAGKYIFDFGRRAPAERLLGRLSKATDNSRSCLRVCLIAEKLRLQERRVSRHQHQQHHRSAGSTNGEGGGHVRALTPDVPPAEKDPREVCPLKTIYSIFFTNMPSIYWKIWIPI